MIDQNPIASVTRTIVERFHPRRVKGNGSSGESWIVNLHRLFFYLYYDQGMETLSLPVLQRCCGNKDDRWNTVLHPASEVVKRGTDHFCMTVGDALREE